MVSIFLAGLIGRLIVVILHFGLLPFPAVAPPQPAAAHTGVADDAITVPNIVGTLETITVLAGESIQAAIERLTWECHFS